MNFQRELPRAVLTAVSLLLILAVACGGGDESPAATTAPAATVAAASDEVVVPILVKGAQNLGTLHVELVYDSSALQVFNFEAGELARNALSESNFDTPGRIIIGIVDTDGIDGDGSVGLVSFRVLGSQGQSALTLEKLAAHDATSLIDIPAVGGIGTFNVANRTFELPEISFARSN